jgi:hypothetical protein
MCSPPIFVPTPPDSLGHGHRNPPSFSVSSVHVDQRIPDTDSHPHKIVIVLYGRAGGTHNIFCSARHFYFSLLSSHVICSHTAMETMHNLESHLCGLLALRIVPSFATGQR